MIDTYSENIIASIARKKIGKKILITRDYLQSQCLINEFVESDMQERDTLIIQTKRECLDFLNCYFSGMREVPDLIWLCLNTSATDAFAFLEAFERLKSSSYKAFHIIVTVRGHLPDTTPRPDANIEYFYKASLTRQNIDQFLDW